MIDHPPLMAVTDQSRQNMWRLRGDHHGSSLGVRKLAATAGVAVNTVARIENGADARQSTMDALQRALEAAGVEFTNGDRPGVRLIRPAEEPTSPKTAGARRAKNGKRKE
jgi:transcriptional regulator with XRE-family HTH domain